LAKSKKRRREKRKAYFQKKLLKLLGKRGGRKKKGRASILAEPKRLKKASRGPKRKEDVQTERGGVPAQKKNTYQKCKKKGEKSNAKREPRPGEGSLYNNRTSQPRRDKA